MLQRIKAFKQIEKELNLSSSRRKELIRLKLKDILVSAYNSVPYYREMMKNIGYDPSKDFTGTDDLNKFPILTKKKLKEIGIKNLIAEGTDISNKFSDSTSGSSGTPLKVYRDSYARSLQIAKWVRVLKVNGYKPTDKVMSLTSPSRLGEGKSILNYFGLFRRKPVSYLNPTGILLDNFLEYNPHILYGNRSQFDLIAMELLERKINPSKFNLKFLVSTGETLRENSRKLYKKAFNADIIDSYGTVEMGVLGYETPAHDGLNLYENLTFYEFLTDDNKSLIPGEPGRIILTDLSNKLMPFIRYEQGDRVVYNKDSDGSIKIISVQGRDDDYITTAEGEKISVHRVAEIVNHYQEILQYRLIQKTTNHIDLYISAEKEYAAKIHDNLYQKLISAFKGIDFKIIRVDNLPPDKTGKLRKLISEVSSVSA